MQNDRLDGTLFSEAALEFCRLVEQIDGYKAELWLREAGDSLLRLDANIVLLTPHTPPTPHIWISDLDKRFELYSRLKDFLGERDEYWSEADLHAGDGYMTGSLSDDFADIYFELKRGLLLAAQGPEGHLQAVQLWASGYRDHWRQHLVDARKQLFDFRSQPPKTGAKIHIGKPPKKLT